MQCGPANKAEIVAGPAAPCRRRHQITSIDRSDGDIAAVQVVVTADVQRSNLGPDTADRGRAGHADAAPRTDARARGQTGPGIVGRRDAQPVHLQVRGRCQPGNRPVGAEDTGEISRNRQAKALVRNLILVGLVAGLLFTQTLGMLFFPISGQGGRQRDLFPILFRRFGLGRFGIGGGIRIRALARLFLGFEAGGTCAGACRAPSVGRGRNRGVAKGHVATGRGSRRLCQRIARPVADICRRQAVGKYEAGGQAEPNLARLRACRAKREKLRPVRGRDRGRVADAQGVVVVQTRDGTALVINDCNTSVESETVGTAKRLGRRDCGEIIGGLDRQRIKVHRRVGLMQLCPRVQPRPDILQCAAKTELSAFPGLVLAFLFLGLFFRICWILRRVVIIAGQIHHIIKVGIGQVDPVAFAFVVVVLAGRIFGGVFRGALICFGRLGIRKRDITERDDATACRRDQREAVDRLRKGILRDLGRGGQIVGVHTNIEDKADICLAFGPIGDVPDVAIQFERRVRHEVIAKQTRRIHRVDDAVRAFVQLGLKRIDGRIGQARPGDEGQIASAARCLRRIKPRLGRHLGESESNGRDKAEGGIVQRTGPGHRQLVVGLHLVQRREGGVGLAAE